MKKITTNQSFIIIAIIYVISWLIPIGFNFNSSNNLMGYNGAAIAQENLNEGIIYLLNIFTGGISLGYEGFIKGIFKIISGLPNYMFLTAFLLAVLKNKYCLHFIFPCILVMLLWGGGEIILGGYTLWLFSGAWLFLISFKIFKMQFTKPNIFLLISTPFLTTYIVGAIAFSSSMIK